MIANILLNKAIGSPGITTYSKYSEFLYSQATGGQGWQAIHLEHPEMTESEAFKLSIDIIRKEPSLLIKGIVKSYSDYFAPVNGGFSFLRLVYVQNNIPDRILWGLLAMGLITAFTGYKQGKYGLILASFVGIFLSLAAVPPTEADDMRVYAVTMPFIFYITSTSITPVSIAIKRLIKSQHKEENRDSTEALKPVAIVILTACLLGPLVVMAIGHPPKYSTAPSCSFDEEKIYFRIGNQSSIALMQDDDVAESYMPNIRVSDFRNSVISGPIYQFRPHLDQELLSLLPGQTINLVTYLPPQNSTSSESTGYLITSGQVLPSGFYAGCGVRPRDTMEVPWFYYKSPLDNQPATTFFIPKFINLVRFTYGAIILFIIFAAATDIVTLRLMSWKKLLLSFGNITVILVGILIYLHSNAVFPLSWQRTRLNMETATLIEGYAYQIPLGVDWMSQKSMRLPPVTVYEDGNPLKNPNANLYQVKHLGKGRFLGQSGYLYISASDNSNPKINGRSYEIEWPTPIRKRYQLLFYSLSLIGILIHIRLHWRQGSKFNFNSFIL